MKHRLSAMWRGCRKYLFIVIVGILVYELCENFTAFRGALDAIRAVISPILVGLCFAFIVNLPVRLLEGTLFKKLAQKRRGVARGLSMLLSYALVLGIIALVIALIIPRVVESVAQLVGNFDSYYEAVSKWVADIWDNLNLREEAMAEILDVTSTLLSKLKALIITALPQVLTFTFGVVSLVFNLLITLVISVYALIKKEKLLSQARRFIIACLPEKSSNYVLRYCTFANKTFRKYIVGQLTSCCIVGLLCYIGMRIFAMPYAELISVFICVAALIPIIGPWVSTIPSAFIILMASPSNPWLALWFIIMIVVIQQLDDNLVYPRIVGDAVGVSGIWVLAAIVIGGGFFGIVGLLVAVPTMAVIYRMVGDWVNKRTIKTAATEPNPASTAKRTAKASAQGEREADAPAESVEDRQDGA